MRLPPVKASLLATTAAVLVLSGCGGGSSTTGTISSVGDRFCLSVSLDNATCFAATPQQLAGYRVGDCVKVAFDQSAGVEPTVTSLARRQDCPPLKR